MLPSLLNAFSWADVERPQAATSVTTVAQALILTNSFMKILLEVQVLDEAERPGRQPQPARELVWDRWGVGVVRKLSGNCQIRVTSGGWHRLCREFHAFSESTAVIRAAKFFPRPS